MRRSGRSRRGRSRNSRISSSRTTETEPRDRPTPEARASASPPQASLYLHLPFCAVKCGYCDFPSFAGVPEALQWRVLEALVSELHGRGNRLRPPTVFLGGGTPSFASEAQLAFLLGSLSAQVDLSGVEEFTAEANPESLTGPKLALLREAGVDRISLGIQSFDPRALRVLGRPHDPAQALRVYELAREAGFENLGMDLIFGLPGQGLEDWVQDLAQALGLEPDHLSCYQLGFEPGTPLQAALLRGEVEAPTEELCRTLFLETRQILGEAGLPPYEISNFARPGRECRHNLRYWRGADYLGLGPGASSHLQGRRSTNLRALEAYVEAIARTGQAAGTAETLDPEKRCREALWLGTRMARGADLAEVEARTGVDPSELGPGLLEALSGEGLCRIVEGRLLLTDEVLLLGVCVGRLFLGGSTWNPPALRARRRAGPQGPPGGPPSGSSPAPLRFRRAGG